MHHFRTGSDEHRRLFCKEFVDTFDNFEIAKIEWPTLDSAAIARLKGLPFWGEAIRTERTAGERVRKMADFERDPLMREAIAMQGFEEKRHAALIEALMLHAGIPVPDIAGDVPRDAEWGFIRMGYGEVFDTFFAFGLFKIAGDTGFFPPELLKIFEVFMQEEVRHIVFFQNWAVYRDRTESWRRLWFRFRRAFAVSIQAVKRIETAIQLSRGSDSQKDFVMKADTIDADMTIRKFAEICLAETERRMTPYDERLLRPRLLPTLVNYALKVLP